MCEAPLRNASRVPVCPACLAQPEPLSAEFMCACCRAPFSSEFPLDEQGRCMMCRLGLSGFDEAYSFGYYEETLRQLIQVFKYGKVTSLARPLGRMLSRALPRDRRYDVIVPMPMHWRRRLERGFNQADLLARELGRYSGLKIEALAGRSKATPPQAGLTSAKRRSNVAAAFKVPRPERVKGRRILLVDDVLTTGASASACAKALKRAGAASVTLLTVARADRRFWNESRFVIQTTGSNV